ncbi:hypothetical protein GOP47_0030699 [Adiantum capillus-veneris]|nr:hypothetical protein GOP47_0030699 [Adiantum capillus-veneris]
MSSLRRRYRNFKKAKANPYAGRGLDKFALVTSELEAKREKLAAELDTPLSMVKFAIGAHNKWVPIILSRSMRKESHPPKKKSGALVNEEKLAVSSRAHRNGVRKGGRTGLIKEAKSGLVCENGGHGMDVAQTGVRTNAGHVGSNVDGQDSHFNGSVAGNTDMLGCLIGEGALRTLGNPFDFGIEHEVSGDVTEFLSASSEVEHIATYKEAVVVQVQGRNVKKMIGAIAGIPWVVSKAASSVVFLKWYAKLQGKTPFPKRESLRDVEKFHAAELSMSISSVPLLAKTSDVLSLPSPPGPLRITSEQDGIVEIMDDAGAPHLETANKQHRKCKVKGLLKIRSAPSTPRDSRQPKKSFTAAKTHGVNGQATASDVDIKEGLLAPRTTKHLTKRRFLNDSSIGARKESARSAGHAFAAAGLVFSLSGLAIGYVSAIIGVVCWWYVLPSLRKAVGDRPTVRSHHGHVKNEALTATNAQSNIKKISKEVGSENSQEYKKKVIMEGLLDRGRRSNS